MRFFDRQERHHCPACQKIHFLDPKVACCALVSGPRGILLIQRDIEPARGLWSYPGGYMDRGETTAEAAAREVLEETGVTVVCDRLLGVYSYPDSIVVVIVYEAHAESGEPELRPECSDIRWFEPHEIPWGQLAFRSVRQALEDLGMQEKAAPA